MTRLTIPRFMSIRALLRYTALPCAGIALLFLSSVPRALGQEIEVTVNGEPVSFSGIGPQMMRGRVLVPVRGVLENIGANVEWNPDTDTVYANGNGTDIRLRLGDRRAFVNGNPVFLDVPAMEIAGRTMVPLRFLSEALGADVHWNDADQTVAIVTNGGNINEQGSEFRAYRRPRNVPMIDNFNYSTDTTNVWLNSGDTVSTVLRGTPGAQASFRIEGMTGWIPMRQTSPGRYVGSYTISGNRAVHLRNASIYGRLQFGNGRSLTKMAGDTVSIDTMR